MSDEDLELGPVDFILIGYPPGSPMTGEAVPILLDLVDRGIVRVLDALVIRKDEDGTFSGFDVRDLEPGFVGDLIAFEGAATGLIGDEDLAAAAAEMPAGSAAALIVYENTWAGPFAAAVRRNGGELLASGRISVQDLIDALEAAEAAE